MPGPRFEHFPHDADIGVRGRGATPAEAFANAALALTAVLADPETIRPLQSVAIECAADDLDALFYDWLNAVVYEMATRRLLFGRFEVDVQEGRLRARAWGEPVDVDRHRPAVEVKGATYTALRVARDAEGWLAECVVDV
jgi:SHS2 domain-containing protein